MEPVTAQPSQTTDIINGGIKRKRSVSAEAQPQPAPPPKAAKPHSNHLQINYLARQYADTLPLVSVEDGLPQMLQLFNDYTGVLERHESLAGNLGARPLGPMLIKRFERLFDGPPRVLKSHGKEGTTVTWLDVVEFARHKPEQFNLEKMRDGVKVCQFYTKQSRVEISEEDYELIASGMPQRLIPPQPIPEDEEKELGTLEIMEKSVASVIQLADQVSAKARHFKQRLLGRKNAIINRRQNEIAVENPRVTPDVENGRNSGSPTSGFVAVNRPANGASSTINGRSAATTASASTRAELITQFNNIRERQGDPPLVDATPPAISRSHNSKAKVKPASDADYAQILLNSASPVPIPNTPSNLVNYPRPTQSADRYDDSGPYKAEMLSRMETLQRGDRVLPPCDRCRRLHMDCLKNLTACQGCTRKHAKCSWKDVSDQELIDNPRPHAKDEVGHERTVEAPAEPQTEGPPQPVRDEELLGEDDSDDEPHAPIITLKESTELEHIRDDPMDYQPAQPKEEEESTYPFVSTAQASTPRAEMTPSTDVEKMKEAQDEIQAHAREILKNRLVEIPASNSSIGGFEAVNRQSAEPSAEVRIHEPSPAFQERGSSYEDSTQPTPNAPEAPKQDSNPPYVPSGAPASDQPPAEQQLSYEGFQHKWGG